MSRPFNDLSAPAQSDPDPAAPGVFRVGQQVALRRELPSLRVDSEGVVRGVSAGASGISYVVRFAQLTRVVSERDLATSPT